MNRTINPTVCVIGLGYIGFPTACIIAKAGYAVLGVDIDQKVVSNIHTAHYSNWETSLKELFIEGMKDGHITLSTKIEPAQIYIITVQTPLTLEKQPDLSYVHAAVASLQPYLQEDNLVLIESTCPIGTTEVIAQQLRTLCKRICVAYCPERILPGNMLDECIYNNRIVGGIDRESGIRAADFYRSFIKGKIEVTDAATAEAVKLAENSYRDINIAYANELSMITDQVGINVYELIRLANQHPRVHILQPGPGVGGHCVSIDPYFLVHASPGFAQLTLKAREVNSSKTDWVIQKIDKQAKAHHIKTIVCLGLTYKANVPDRRQSPAITIVEALKKDFEIIAMDPYVENDMTYPIASLHEILLQADMVVLLVAHDLFLTIPNHWLCEKLFLDFTGTFLK